MIIYIVIGFQAVVLTVWMFQREYSSTNFAELYKDRINDDTVYHPYEEGADFALVIDNEG